MGSTPCMQMVTQVFSNPLAGWSVVGNQSLWRPLLPYTSWPAIVQGAPFPLWQTRAWFATTGPTGSGSTASCRGLRMS